MALPTTTISMSQVNTELGRSATASINLNETAVRTLAGVASGAISMDNLRGKSSAATWTPDGGPSAGSRVVLSDEASGGSASIVISCSQTAVWAWTRSGSTAGTATVVNGGSATSITFNLPNPTTTGRFCTFTVTSTASGVSKYYTVTLSNTGLL